MLKKSSWLLFLLLLCALVACSGRGEPEPEEEPVTEEVATAEIAEATNAPTAEAEPDPTATIPPTEVPQITASILTDLDGLEGTSPHLIGSFPDVGGELGTTDGIELYFDQPMDRQRTAEAITLVSSEGETIAGTVEWIQPRVLRFQPDIALVPASQYELILAESAASEEGEPLLEALTIPIQTVGALEVTQVSPAPGSADILADSAITVIFNRPVVPLVINQEQDDLPNPLEITPAAEGNGEWVNTSVYVWRPSEPLIGRQIYTVKILADVVNGIGDGADMAANMEWTFGVIPPSINRLTLPGSGSRARDNYQHMRLNQALELVFNQPMDTTSTESAINMSSTTGQVPLEFSWNELQTTVTFTPTQLLDLGTDYILNVSSSAQSIYGGQIREGLVWRATTSYPPAIVRTIPTDGDTAVKFSSRFKIDFASRMNAESIKGKIIFDPSISGDPDGSYNSWEWSQTFWGLAPSTTYTVRILPGMTDIHGNPINEERVVTFTTAAYAPSVRLQMHSPFAIYRQGGETAVWVAYRNLSDLPLDVSQLNVSDFMVHINEYGGTQI